MRQGLHNLGLHILAAQSEPSSVAALRTLHLLVLFERIANLIFFIGDGRVAQELRRVEVHGCAVLRPVVLEVVIL